MKNNSTRTNDLELKKMILDTKLIRYIICKVPFLEKKITNYIMFTVVCYYQLTLQKTNFYIRI